MANPGGDGTTIKHKPTAHSRELARQAAGLGLPHAMIATLITAAGLPCSERTLQKYYGDELKVGKAQATMQVAKTLYSRATNGDLGAAIFWLKAQAGWREKHVLDDEKVRHGLLDLVLASGLGNDATSPAQPPAEPEAQRRLQ